MSSRKLSKNSKNLRKNIKTRKSASAQAKQLARTNARIDSLALKVLDQKSTYGLKLEETPLALDPLNVYRAIPLCPTLVGTGSFSVWGQCFANSEKALDAERVRLGRVYTKMGFYAGTEPGPTSFSVFHIKLQPDTAEELIDDAGESLASLTADKHYITGHGTGIDSGIGSHVMLNPQYFRIQKQWNFTLQNRNANAATANDQVPYTAASAHMKVIPYSFPLGYKIGAHGNKWRWSTAPTSHELEKRNFILVFCDGTSLDAENPSFRILAQCNASC